MHARMVARRRRSSDPIAARNTPLAIIGQWMVVDWPIHCHLKFLLVCAGVASRTPVTYQIVFRNLSLHGRAAKSGGNGPVESNSSKLAVK